MSLPFRNWFVTIDEDNEDEWMPWTVALQFGKQHYCTKALQLHWVSNQASGRPRQGLLGGYVKGFWATTSGAPGWPHQGLLSGHVRGSWEVISGAPKQPSQSHQGAQQAPGSGKSAREIREEGKLVWTPFSCREGNKQPCAWSAARGQAHFLVKVGK